MTTLKCDGREGGWEVRISGGTNGTLTFTFPDDSTSAESHGVYDLGSGGGAVHWDVRGPVSFIAGTDSDPPMLSFARADGTATVRAMGQTITTPTSQEPFDLPLEEGDFC